MTLSIQISQDRGLDQQIKALNDAFEERARKNLAAALSAPGSSSLGFTTTEKQAMIKLEQVKLIGGLSLAEILLRGQVIQEIENRGLWAEHPEGFNSMEEAAEAQGISQSEYSNIRDLCSVIFPYFEERGIPVSQLWTEIGKSKLRELTPILKRVITGEESRSDRVERTFENMMDDVFASAHARGDEITNEEARGYVIDQLLEAGQMPVREMRQQIRPDRTPSIEGFALPYRNGRQVVMVIVDEDQREMLNRRLTGYIDVTPVSQEDVQRSPTFRELARYLGGNE